LDPTTAAGGGAAGGTGAVAYAAGAGGSVYLTAEPLFIAGARALEADAPLEDADQDRACPRLGNRHRLKCVRARCFSGFFLMSTAAKGREN